MSNLTPIDQPSLQPLRSSFEADQLENELKTVFMMVFESMVRPRERELNLYGMAHLGDVPLIERNLKEDGLAMIRRDDFRMRFLLKAWRARNPKRGLLFLQKYLQTVWPNEWSVDQLWHPSALSNLYPTLKTVDGDPDTHFLTSRVRVGVTVEADDGTGLVALQKALRSIMAARIVLEMALLVNMTNIGENGGIGLANGFGGTMPLYSRGTLQNIHTEQSSSLAILNGASGSMPFYVRGTLKNKNTEQSTSLSINSGASGVMPIYGFGKLQ